LTTFSICPTGYIGPGGLSLSANKAHCTGGFNKDVDETIFGYNHIYQTPTTTPIYGISAYDPEGFLGSLNSTFLTFLGLLIGDFFVAIGDKAKRIFFLLGTGILMVV